jgi:mono/diheme cytochrome c family protein
MVMIGKMKKNRYWNIWIIIVVLILGIGMVSACSRSYASNGERIYFTATSESGDSISYRGSIRMMHSIACVNCHGADGKGGRVNMMMWSFETPDISWDHLTSEEHHEEGSDEEDHPPYTEETVKQAITEGINPAGEPLDQEMPRWSMSQDDLNDLLEYLKTLE